MVRLLKPEFIGHFDPKKKTRHAIYSIDFQPNGGRLATGGGDCSVKLWNTEFLISCDDANLDQALLATLSTHTKSVNVVRWSKDGRFLASGSDDCYILIYKYSSDAISSQPFGNSAHKNKESWVRCYTLQGHVMDVLDLDWSSSGLLASASIDNNILLWDFRMHISGGNRAPANNGLFGAPAVVASTLMAPMKVLVGHHSFVKGVSFDPVGRYLASCGADNIIIIWDVDSWSALHRLDGPLRAAPDRTIFRRMSWAPDGSSLCITAATKSAKPVGMVLKRTTWESVADLVGHDAPSICCKFCPDVLGVAPHDDNDDGDNSQESTDHYNGAIINDITNGSSTSKNKSSGSIGSNKRAHANKAGSRSSSAASVSPACCVALGDQLGVVSLWSTSRNKPLLVLRHALEGAATDVAWSHWEGPSSSSSSNSSSSSSRRSMHTVFCVASLDGTVLLVDLGELT
jgi:WD40 repeat protein